MTKHYKVAQNRLEDAFWTDVYREVPYHENDNIPTDNGNINPKGRMVGECDILLVNEEEQVALYEELKTGYKGLGKADDQTTRFEEFFDDTEWDIYTRIILEQ